MSGYVYFIQAGEADAPIKIGYAKNVDTRLKAIQCTQHEPCQVLAYVPGSIEVERALHAKFATSHKSGEWFEASFALITFIEDVRERGEAALIDAGVELAPPQPKAASPVPFSHHGFARFLRKAAPECTVQSISKQTGISQSTIEAWLMEKSAPQMKHLGVLLETFGLPILLSCYPALLNEPWVDTSRNRERKARLLEEQRAIDLEILAMLRADVESLRERLNTEIDRRGNPVLPRLSAS